MNIYIYCINVEKFFVIVTTDRVLTVKVPTAFLVKLNTVIFVMNDNETIE